MAKLYFFHSTMSAGKTTSLLQYNHTCLKRNVNTLIFITNVKSSIESRIGLKKNAIQINNKFNIYKYIKKYEHMIINILVDEAQFLTKKQVYELITIVDNLKINVLTYGLRTDFKLKLFTGSKYLLSLSDKIIEIKTLCKCGKKAITNIRLTKIGKKTLSGKQINLNKKIYIPTCRYHYFNFKKLK